MVSAEQTKRHPNTTKKHHHHKPSSKNSFSRKETRTIKRKKLQKKII